jgi:hypothetical protein
MPWTPGVPQWWTMRINWNRTSIDTIRFSSGHTRTVTTQTPLTKDNDGFSPERHQGGVGWGLGDGGSGAGGELPIMGNWMMFVIT